MSLQWGLQCGEWFVGPSHHPGALDMNQKPELQQAFCVNAHLSGCLILLAVSTVVGVVVKLGRCDFIAFFFVLRKWPVMS